MVNLLSFLLPLLSNWQRIVIYAVLILAVAAGLVGYGYIKGSERLFSYQVEQAKQGALIVTKQAKVTERIITRYVKVKEASQVVTNALEKETQRYAESNPGFCLDGDWRRLHDAAATHTIPSAPSLSDGEAGAPQAATALATVTDNYAACHRNADRLELWQEWAKEQAKVR